MNKNKVPKTTPRKRMDEQRVTELWGSGFDIATSEKILRENLVVLGSELEDERNERDRFEQALIKEIAAHLPTELEFQALKLATEAAESAALKYQMDMLEQNEGMLIQKEKIEELQLKLKASEEYGTTVHDENQKLKRALGKVPELCRAVRAHRRAVRAHQSAQTSSMGASFHGDSKFEDKCDAIVLSEQKIISDIMAEIDNALKL